jgi:sortase A
MTPALGVECALPKDFRPYAKDRRRLPWVALLVTLAGAVLFGQGAYVQAKAWLAQILIERAWSSTLAGQSHVKPWRWADTWPVARLIHERSRRSLYVLAGANGRTIAFGPGHQFGTPLPGDRGNSVIGGHRDTHLAFLRDVKIGERVEIERADGVRITYRVTDTLVVDKRDAWLMKNEGPTRITLVTCWPFDALRAGGSERYAVIATRI